MSNLADRWGNQSQWLLVDGKPRLWLAMSELLASPNAPAEPFETWSPNQVLAAMFFAIERRADLMEVTTETQ
jgi:hypothetical protein